MITRIASVGACVTRDNFNSKFNPHYKMFFNLVLHQHQISIPSLMSKSITYEENQSIAHFRDFDKRQLQSECDKRFLDLVKKEQPEYLLIDFDADVNFGVIKIDDETYFTNNPKYKDVFFLEKYENRLQMKDDPDLYFNIWKPKVDEFFAFIGKEVPDCKIILVKARFSDYFRDGTNLTDIRKKKNQRILDVNYLNKLWERLDQYVIDNFDVKVIDMTEKQYFVSSDHPWGAYYLHFEKEFYHDFLNKLLQIVLADYRAEIDNLTQKIQQISNQDSAEEQSLFNSIKKLFIKNS